MTEETKTAVVPWLQMICELRNPFGQRVGWESNETLMSDAADEIERLAALANRDPQAGEPVAWRPIETAPTDGTKVMVYPYNAYESPGFTVAHYATGWAGALWRFWA